MSSQRVSRAFKDISFAFDPHPVTKDLPVLLINVQSLDLYVI